MRTPRRPPRDPARAAALDVVAGTRVRDAYANLLLPPILARYGLSGRDAGLVTELAAGTLRMRGLYDAVLATRINRPLESLDADVLDVLRLGCHQLLSMRVPSHAAVSTSVELVRERMGPRPTGLVNAVLRKVAQRDLAGWVRDVAPAVEQDPYGHLAVAHSHPRWIVDELAHALDADAELPELLSADNRVGAATLVVRPGRADVEELLVAGARRGRLSPYAVHLQAGSPGDVPAVREGRAGVQDEGSQVVALLTAAVPVEGRDQRWLDLCAGPGGKAALLGALGAGRGATLTANESQPHRAALVEQAVAGLAGVTVVVGDARHPAWRPATYDRVLVDAP
nr:rRNA cytosine-C5-methyltransferase [Actinomycetota bacterium]